MECLFSNKGSWRQNGRRALPPPPALALSAKPRPSFGLQRGDLNVCAQLRLYKVPGSGDKSGAALLCSPAQVRS